jgi:hypothetical protein
MTFLHLFSQFHFLLPLLESYMIPDVDARTTHNLVSSVYSNNYLIKMFRERSYNLEVCRRSLENTLRCKPVLHSN